MFKLRTFPVKIQQPVFTPIVPDVIVNVEKEVVHDVIVNIETDIVPDVIVNVETDIVPDIIVNAETDVVPDVIVNVEPEVILDISTQLINEEKQIIINDDYELSMKIIEDIIEESPEEEHQPVIDKKISKRKPRTKA